MKKIILVDGNYIKLSINEEIENYLNYDLDFYKNIFSHEVERLDSTKRYVKMDLEDIKDYLIDSTYEEIDNFLPIYNSDIMEEFQKLSFIEIDYIVSNSGWLEYNPKDGFCKFALGVLYEVEKNKIDEDLEKIFQYIEVGYDEEDYNNLKEKILYTMDNHQDLELKKMYIEFLEDGFSDSIIQYIVDILIGTEKEMGIHSQYIEEFGEDEYIKTHIREWAEVIAGI